MPYRNLWPGRTVSEATTPNRSLWLEVGSLWKWLRISNTEADGADGITSSDSAHTAKGVRPLPVPRQKRVTKNLVYQVYTAPPRIRLGPAHGSHPHLDHDFAHAARVGDGNAGHVCVLGREEHKRPGGYRHHGAFPGVEGSVLLDVVGHGF